MSSSSHSTSDDDSSWNPWEAKGSHTLPSVDKDAVAESYDDRPVSRATAEYDANATPSTALGDATPATPVPAVTAPSERLTGAHILHSIGERIEAAAGHLPHLHFPGKPHWLEADDPSVEARAKRYACYSVPVVVLAFVAAIVVVLILEKRDVIHSPCHHGECDAPPPPSSNSSKVNGHVRATTNFTYEGDTGPAYWGQLSPTFLTCSDGTNQSPVDVSVPNGVNTTMLTFGSAPLWRRYDNTLFHIVSRPSHPGFQLEPTNVSVPSWWIIDGLNYTLLQFHFHRPSEHTINGSHFAAEAHFVHRNIDTGNIAVFGVVFDDPTTLPGGAAGLNISDNAYLASFWGQIHTPTFNVFASVASLVDDVHEDYFRYNGSLTTPPCTEAVAWHVTRSNTPMSSGQVADLEFALKYENNSRPIQPLNSRLPLELDFGPFASYDDGSGSGSDGGHHTIHTDPGTL